jgi:predicted RNA-binding Zn ribbon-like protein
VVFAHDTTAALQAAAALVNSAEPPDTMTTPDELDEFFAAHDYTGSRTHDAAELAAVRALRAPLRRLLTADRDEAVRIVNEILAERHAVPALVRHDGWDYHLHAIDAGAPLADRIAVETAMAMIDVIRADEMSRLDTCAADDCDDVVLDLSRNRSRRYCSTTCGNREAVAAYRARQRT